jgi:hypothetical protein
MQPQTQFFDLYRSGLKTMNDVMKTSLETTERLQNQQLQQVRNALEETTKSTGQLGDVRSLDELMAVQARLAGSQLQRTMDFWGSVWRAAGDGQIAMISQMQSFTRATEEAVRMAASNSPLREAAPQQERHQQQRKTG